MARPKKKGLDYFPLDVGIFEDEKLFDVQEKYGPLGEVIYLRLLCLIYKNGYYYKFDSIDKLAAIVIRSIGNRWTRNKQAVKEVILYLAECNLFSSELMQRNVITARSIQQRYLKALERNQPEINEYSLIGEKTETDTGFVTVPENLISVAETPVFATETPVNAYNNDTKEKESKVKESKVDERKGEEIFPALISLAFVKLSSEQYTQLTARYPKHIVDDYIQRVDDYAKSKGRGYPDYAMVIARWIDQDVKSGKTSLSEPSYDSDEWGKMVDSFDPSML